MVDRLLASPHYGERWGRHWLDLARYADSDGYTIDAPAADLEVSRLGDRRAQSATCRSISSSSSRSPATCCRMPTTDQLIATGFHRNTPSQLRRRHRLRAVSRRSGRRPRRHDGRGFLGLTLGCARCHDHKFDPISQREFYQLFAFFNNMDEITSEAERYDFNRPFLELATPEELARKEAFQAQIAQLSRELANYVKTAGGEAARSRAIRPSTRITGLLERVANLRASSEARAADHHAR